ncbi:MAG: D-alanine--D-alanine ligase [Planctomycetes bacterium]|nr:D-alanine--D-alanine ligase [Planctomycetota bacterium]
MEGTDAQPGESAARLRVTVLMGGPSSEREVSLLSGSAVADALERRGHEVTRADISPSDTTALDRGGIDVVFIALHGAFGESGQVQRLCRQRGLAYTGSPPRASELAMDKAATKQVARRIGLASPDWMIIEEHHAPPQVRTWLAELPPPVVVKPVDGGSSIDLTIARSASQRDAALDDLLDRYGRAMVERYVRGRELTVGILAGRALPVLEIIPPGESYDYHAKYADDAGTRYTFDHGLDESLTSAVQRDALALHRELGCRDMSRVDFLLDEAGTAWLLEINTIPGFTSHSLLPMAAARVGIGFDELVERIARMAYERGGAE